MRIGPIGSVGNFTWFEFEAFTPIPQRVAKNSVPFRLKATAGTAWEEESPCLFAIAVKKSKPLP
jgi:hypothetical protein